MLQTTASRKKRVSATVVAPSDLEDLVDGNTAFAFDVYQALRGEEGNLLYSPYSMSLALAMTFAGARGETERQIANTLRFNLPQDRLHPAFNGLDVATAGRGSGDEAKGKGLRLDIVNELWGQEGYEFLAGFLDVLAENYGVGVRLLDFQNSPEASRIAINDWASGQTDGRIEDLVPSGVIDELTRLLLTSAIYLQAAWLRPFSEILTHDGIFHLLDGSKTVVSMMTQAANFGYAEGEWCQAVELPYDGRELSMVIMLPEAGRFEAFEGSLDAELLGDITKDLTNKRIGLTVPRFEIKSALSLKKTLAAMGMPAAFSPAADFSGMTDERDLHIGGITQEAFVSVDEAGTEAAAATAVEAQLLSIPQPVAVDRPFVFLIRDLKTHAVLFLGRVVDPSA